MANQSGTQDFEPASVHCVLEILRMLGNVSPGIWTVSKSEP